MSSMDERGGEPRRLRAGDAERDAVVAQLREHHEAGRLDVTEFEERMGAALAARWRDELPPLLVDLPDQRAEAGDGPAEHAVGGRPGGRSTPPWAAAGWLGHGWPGHRGVRHWSGLPPVVPVLAIIAVFMSIGAVSHGHFPFPLLWLGFVVLWLRGRGRRAAWARQR